MSAETGKSDHEKHSDVVHSEVEDRELPPGIRAIIRVKRESLIEALQYLWLEGSKSKPNPEYAERFVQYADGSNIALDQCFACQREDSRLFPAALAITNPGRTAMIFASHLTSRARQSQTESAALYEYLADNLDRNRVGLAQVLLTKAEQRAIPSFETAGFFRLAELLYLERKIPRPNRVSRTISALPPAPDWPSGVTLESYDEKNQADFKQAIADSYEGTLDCPGLCALRSIDEVFLGHQGTGIFDPDLWTLVRIKGKPAAILLLSAFADQDILELTYLGVGPAARGMGLGRRLIAHGLGIVQREEHSRMTLAADEKNEPALKLYRDAGFHQTDRRTALVLPIGKHR